MTFTPLSEEAAKTASVDARRTEAELLQRAEQIAETLLEQQVETEARTYYSEQTHEVFADANFYRMLTPRRFGGLEVDLATYFKVCMTIARGCPSTGWCFTLGTSHAILAASFFSEQAQAELFADTDFISPQTQNPLGTARREGDGWVVNATHPFASGAPYANFYMGHAMIEGEEPEILTFVAPRSQWKRLDDWGDMLGQKGSGSHSVHLENTYIPAHFAIPYTNMLFIDTTNGTEGTRLHGNPMYGGNGLSFLILEMAVLAVGMSLGALDEYARLMRTKRTTFPPIQARTDSDDYRRWYGTAYAKIETARAAVLQTIEQWLDLARIGNTDELAADRIVVIGREAIQLCWAAVSDLLMRTSGSTSLRDGERMQRIFRDLATLYSHTGTVSFSEHATVREIARRTFDA